VAIGEADGGGPPGFVEPGAAVAIDAPGAVVVPPTVGALVGLGALVVPATLGALIGLGTLEAVVRLGVLVVRATFVGPLGVAEPHAATMPASPSAAAMAGTDQWRTVGLSRNLGPAWPDTMNCHEEGPRR
jgi:hypothetical protein